MESSVSVTYVESAAMSQRKKTVIDILRDSHDFVSGEAISDVLGISRNAVHKHVKSLRKRGYRIVGVSRRGYRLEDEPARLSMGHVTQRTENTMFGHSFRYHDEIESTNLEAKSLAMKGAPEGTVVVAEAQTAGRGRLGRRWTSPAGKGLLFSVDPAPVAADERGAPADDRGRDRGRRGDREARRRRASPSSGPTTSSSATARSAGILMEVSGEQDEVDWVVLGIGLNVNTEFSELPVALRRTATSLKMVGGETVDRSDVLATLLLSLEAHYQARAARRLREGAHRLPRARLPAGAHHQRRDAAGAGRRRRRRHRRPRRAPRGTAAPPRAQLPLRAT